MSQSQYLKMLEREIQKINEKIDRKILQGQRYAKEAHEHKLLLKKVRYISRQNLFSRMFPRLHRYAKHFGQATFTKFSF